MLFFADPEKIWTWRSMADKQTPQQKQRKTSAEKLSKDCLERQQKGAPHKPQP